MRPAVSRFAAGFRVGADFFSRHGWVVDRDVAPRGVVDRIADLGHPALDLASIDPAVVPFFEDTCGLELHIRSHWRFPFSLGWRLVRPLIRWIGQFVYPVHDARIVTRGFALDGDGRPDARAIVRTYVDTGDVMQAVSYATWERAGTRYMSAAFPLPGGRLMGILRLDPLGKGAVVLTSKGGDAGVWLVLGPLAIPTPFGERLELWPPGATGAPDEAPPAGLPAPTIVGRHEQSFFGVRLVTHHYWFWPSSREPRSRM